MPAYNSSSPVVNHPVSTDYRIAALEAYFTNGSPLIWLNKNISFSFPASGSKFNGGTNYARGEVGNGQWQGLNGLQQDAVRKALATWAAVADITFTEVADGDTVGDLRFGFSLAVQSPQAAYAYGPSTAPQSGDVWMNFNNASGSFAPGSENFYLLVHEIGHALGLSHPFTGETRGTLPLSSAENTQVNTVMSYNITGTGWLWTPMPYDILAIQHLYGPSTASSGNTTYRIDLSSIRNETIWDAGGVDTIEITNTANYNLTNAPSRTTVINLNLNASAVYSNTAGLLLVGLAQGVVIENVIATNGHDVITGNAVNNSFNGKGGSDIIEGGAGVDTVVYDGSRGQYLIAGNRVTDSQSIDVREFFITKPDQWRDGLTGVERLQFADSKVALDINGNAGIAARIIGAVFGPAAVTNKQYVGIGLGLLDAGTSSPSLMQVALDFKLGKVHSNTDVVQLLYTNVMGFAPGAADMAYFRGLLDNGTSQGNLGMAAANHAQNQAHIDLVGLAVTGIAYI